MKKKLFRKQSIREKNNRLQGTVLVTPAVSHSVITGLLLIWTCLVLVWLLTSTFAKKEQVLGWIEPIEGVAHVYPRRGDDENGIVTKLFVKEGDLIEAGDLLLIISQERNLAEGVQLESLIHEEFVFRRKMLSQQMERSNEIFEGEQKNLKGSLVTAKKTLSYLVRKEDILTEHKSLLVDRSKNSKKLNQTGLVSSLSLENDAIEILKLEAEIAEVKKNQIDVAATIEKLETEFLIAPKKHANEVDFLAQQISEIKQNEARLFEEQSYVIKASRSGKISSLQAQVGLRADQSVPLLSIIPPDAKLIAHMLVPVKSVPFVAPGQNIRIRYDAFPYQKFGTYEGEVLTVTENLLLPEQLAKVPVPMHEPAYLVKAKIEKKSISAFKHAFQLKSGMTFSAEIKLDQRSLFEWVLEPVLSLKEKI